VPALLDARRPTDAGKVDATKTIQAERAVAFTAENADLVKLLRAW